MAAMIFFATLRTVVERLIPKVIPNSAVLTVGCQSNTRMAVNQVSRGNGESAATVPVLSPVYRLHCPHSQDRRAWR